MRTFLLEFRADVYLRSQMFKKSIDLTVIYKILNGCHVPYDGTNTAKWCKLVIV